MVTMQFAVASNQVKCKRSALSLAAQEVDWDNQRVTATVKVLPTATGSVVGVIARANLAGDTMYLLQLVKDGGCHLQLYGVVGGTYNLIWSQTDPGSGSTVPVNHTVTLDATGSVVTVAVDGAPVFAAINTLVGAGAYAGIVMDNTVARLDDWSATKSTTLTPFPSVFWTVVPHRTVDTFAVDTWEVAVAPSGTYYFGWTSPGGITDFTGNSFATPVSNYHANAEAAMDSQGLVVTEFWISTTGFRADAVLVQALP